MDFLLFFFGPLLAFGLPVLHLSGSILLGLATSPSTAKLLGFPFLLAASAALVVPARARLSSTNDWPAPWWFAAYFGEFKYEPRYFLVIAACGIGGYFLAVLVRLAVSAVWTKFKVSPNPSIERTRPGKPGRASHVKR